MNARVFLEGNLNLGAQTGSDQKTRIRFTLNDVTDPGYWENKMVEALTRTNCPREQSIGKKKEDKIRHTNNKVSIIPRKQNMKN